MPITQNIKEDTTSQVIEQISRSGFPDRSFDIQFWQSQSSGARFSASWDLIVFAQQRKGADSAELRLHRAVESIQRS